MFDLKSIYFNSAYFGPTPIRSKELVEQALKRTMDPSGITNKDWLELPDKMRERIAALMGVNANNIALSTSVSEIVSHVANGISLSEQEEVLLLGDDFPSMILPWMVLAERRGFKVRQLPVATFQDPLKLKKEFSVRTRFVGCSHVMFNTGIKLPIAEIGKVCRERGVLFMADTSQSFGGMRLTKEIFDQVDIMAGVCYKWMLGPFGSAYGYFSNNALGKIRRTHANWTASPGSHEAGSLLHYSTRTLPGARKFDRGQGGSFLMMAALEGALDTLAEIGMETIESANRELTLQFLHGLPRGYDVDATGDNVSNIVCFRPPTMDANALKDKLAAENIEVSVREGRLRASFHFFNTPEQVERLLQSLPRAEAQPQL